MTASLARPPSPDGAALMIATAAFLEQGRALDGLSRLLTAGAALLFLLFAPFAGPLPSETAALMAAVLVSAVLLGLAELYFAFRVGFDAALFRQLATGPALNGLGELDASLARLGLRPETAGPRPLDDRIRGARRLLRNQALCLVLQVATMVVAAGFLTLQ
jgi:hypothetical protein